MKRFFWFVTLFNIVFFLNGCLKDTGNNTPACQDKTPQSEEGAMLAYASANGMTPIGHTSGLRYQIINPGSGGFPTTSSKIFVKYTGKLTSTNAVFDSQTNSGNTGWFLSTLIPGWQIGIPLIQKGGTIKLIVPSSLAYGCVGNGPIPANSILYFEVELVDIQ